MEALGQVGAIVLGTISTVFLFLSIIYTTWEWVDERIGRVGCFIRLAGLITTFIFVINVFWEVL